MDIIKFKDSSVSVDEDATITIVLPSNPVIALKISLAEHLAIQGKICEVLTEQNQIPSDVINIIRDNIGKD